MAVCLRLIGSRCRGEKTLQESFITNALCIGYQRPSRLHLNGIFKSHASTFLYQVQDKHETYIGPRPDTVAISDPTGVLSNDDAVNFWYRNVT